MSFETNVPGYLLLGDDETNVWGTAMLDNTFGEVTKLDVVRDADLNEIENGQGGLLAAILTKLRWEMDIEVVVKNFATPTSSLPTIGQQVTFEEAGVKGNIIGGIRLMWATKTAKKLAFRAAHWDSIGEVTAATVGAGA